MDFSLSEAQTELAGLARKILAGSDEPWRDLAGAGVLAAGLPEALGGAGLGFLEQCSVLAEVGRAVSPVPYLASAVLAAGAIAEFGSADQQQRWAVPAGDGSAVLTVALAEEDGGDPAAPTTRAASPSGAASPSARAGQAGGHWLLSGVKTAVPTLEAADLVLVPATAPAARADESDEVMVFLIQPSDSGVSVQRQALTDGAPAGRLVLDGVTVSADRVLGGPGQGAQVARWLTARATVGLCAAQAGVLQRALELTAEYARTREQFGRPIGSFQAVAQRLADGYIDVEAVWLTMWQAAWQLSSGHADEDEVAAAVATAKFWAADAGHRVAHTAVHVHGGTGIDLSHPIHRYFTAAKHAEFTLGGATQQLVTLGDLLA